MNVKELIEILKTCDPDAMVVRRGYEGGVNEVTSAETVLVELNVYTDWYYGKHEIVDSNDSQKNVVNAIYVN